MDGTFSGIGSGARPRVLSRATLAAVALGILAVVVTGLILFFPKAKEPKTVAVSAAATQPVRPPTTAPASMVLPSPAVAAVTAVPAKPVSAVKAVKSSAKPKTVARSKARPSKHTLVRSKAKTSKVVAARSSKSKTVASHRKPSPVRVASRR